MFRMTRAGICLGIAVCLAVSPGCDANREHRDGTVSRPLPANGHERMVQRLATIRDQRPYRRLMLGELDVASLEHVLDGLPEDGPPAQRFEVLCELGQQQLFLGNNQAAVRHIKSAYALLPLVEGLLPHDRWEEVVFYLAVAYLRIGETQNCVHCTHGESCLLPISPRGVHTDQHGSREAIRYLKLLLDRNEQHLAARWLLNIACMTVGEYPQGVPKDFLLPPERLDSQAEFRRFRNVAADVGLDTVSLAGGSIVDDFDSDGLLDVVVSSWGEDDQMRMFSNNGDGTFSDRTTEAGLTGLLGGLNMVQADYDNDGDPDILVLRGGWNGQFGQIPNSLLQNDGTGKFQDVTFEVGLAEVDYPTQTAAWADYDNDGDLDLYIGNEHVPSQLFQNDGHGRFLDVAPAAGVENNSFAKGVTWGDYDNDRFPDLYVSNMSGANRLYHNQGNGTFVDVTDETQLAGPHESFPTWFWDFDNDGALDLFVASYPYGIEFVAADYFGEEHSAEPDHLYRGDARGGFENVSAAQGLTGVTEPMGANFGDLDNDGFLDVYLGTGYPGYEGLMPNVLLHNQRGTGFADVTTAAGMGHLQKGHGISFADLDHDGDLDVFAELGGAFPGDVFANALFENPGFENHWIAVRLRGVTSNRSAIGARIKVTILEDGQQREVYRHVNSGGSFGANPLRQHIGLGSAERITSLEIFWPTTGRTQRFEDLAADQLLEITEDQQHFQVRELKPIPFSDPGTRTGA
jgi:hypothetical protein